MEKKRILFYNGQLFMGGIERVLISYLQGLAKEKDLEITVLIKENDPEKNIFFKDIPKNLPVIFIKTEEMVKFRNKVKNNKKNIFCRLLYPLLLSYERIYMKKWLKKFMQENKEKFDIVIDFDMSLGKYLDVIPLPKIGWVHYNLSSKKGKKKVRLSERLKKYDKIVNICDEMLQEMIQIFDVPKDRLYRLYNPFDIDIVKKNMEAEVESEDEKFLKNEYMVAVSRLAKGKEREDLIDIYYNLKNKGIKDKLYIIGDGPQKSELEEKIKELNLEKDVLLLGQKKNPFPWMKNAKLFLHTSYGEGLPTVFLESMICGTAVIAYDCPTGPKDILGKNEYGILVKNGDKKSFEEEIINLLDDENRKKYMLDKFMKEKIKEFDVKYIVEQFKKLINFGDEE